MEIKAYGQWDSYVGKWNINLSSILTQLIFDSAKYCDRYASDLFIDWQIIENEISKANIEDKTMLYKFGFRESGIDHKEWVEMNKSQTRYYRKIRTLEFKFENELVTATLF